MRLIPKLAIGGVVTTSVIAPAIVAGSLLLGTTALVVAGPGVAPANADSLTRIDSCPALLDWYVENAQQEVGPWGWDGNLIGTYYRELGDLAGTGAAPIPLEAQKSAAGSRTNSTTGTNTQEADVDEPDLAKTNGSIVVHLVNQRRVEILDVTGDQPQVLSSYRIPEGWAQELILVGEHVIVLANPDDAVLRHPFPGPGAAAKMVANGTRVLDLDISDPRSPQLVTDQTYTGRLVSARQYGDTIRLVTNTAPPDLPWVTPGGKSGVRPKEARQRNRALVGETTIEEWLPRVRDNLSGSDEPLLDCDDVYRPQQWSGLGTVTVTTYQVEDPATRSTVAVTVPGDVVYSSADRLYVTSTDYQWRTADTALRPAPLRLTTQVHAFGLDALATTYRASGHVAGQIKDRWSLDEHDGDLRVAWGRGDGRKAQNGVTVLREADGALRAIGTVDGLGIDESIQSVRWFDDVAIVVTFRQMDPLYTVDLSDPAHPRALGALKIPGYSAYLHPIGGDRLLGLGVQANSKGERFGAQAAVFDIADLTDPVRLSHLALGQGELATDWEPRAFAWLADRNTAVALLDDWDRGGNRAITLDVGADGQLTTRTLPGTAPYDARPLPLPDGRIALVGGTPKVQLLTLP